MAALPSVFHACFEQVDASTEATVRVMWKYDPPEKRQELLESLWHSAARCHRLKQLKQASLFLELIYDLRVHG